MNTLLFSMPSAAELVMITVAIGTVWVVTRALSRDRSH